MSASRTFWKEMVREDLRRSRAEDVLDRLVQDDKFRAFVYRRVKELGVAKQ